jgi:hypothetical protein
LKNRPQIYGALLQSEHELGSLEAKFESVGLQIMAITTMKLQADTIFLEVKVAHHP